MLPSMRPVTKRAALQLLEAITDEQLDRLSTHFGMPVTLDRGGHKLAKNHEFLLDEAEFRLDDADLFQQIAITRDADTVYISSWR